MRAIFLGVAISSAVACGGNKDAAEDSGGPEPTTAPTTDTETDGTALTIEGDVAAGGELFALRCAGCHGPSGEGGVGPALADGLIASLTDADVLTTMLEGAGSEMPSFDYLSERELANLLAFVRDSFGS